MHENDLKLVEESFKKFYFEHFDLIHVPSRPSEREFGYQKFDGGMTRHLSVKDDKALHLMLITNVPSDVYCSNAYYSFPNLPMKEKDWKQADLIFDIDAKDLNLGCRSDHACLICNSCSNVSLKNKTCPKCNSTKFEIKSIPCKNCISASKNEVEKLCNILINDFAINEKDIEIFFSGNEGFHVYAYNSQFQTLGSRERAELSDYVMFRGAIPETFGFNRYNPKKSEFVETNESGWRKIVLKEIFSPKSKRPKIIKEIISNGYSMFQKQLVGLSQSIGARIDPNVTMDVHRIFRLPGSINSKSGLVKMKCYNLKKFDPFNDACHLDDGLVEVMASCPISFKLKQTKFGPYYNEKVSIPKFAAVYMICKGFATSALKI